MNAQRCLAGSDITPADMQLVFDALAEGVLILAADGQVVFINDSATRILGVERSKAVQLGWDELREHQRLLDIAALPARTEDLCRADCLELPTPSGTGGKRFLCRIRPVCTPEGQLRLVALVIAETAPLPQTPAQGPRSPTGQPGFAAPEPQQPAEVTKTTLREASPEQQRELLCRTLEATGWNVAKAARRLKLSRTTLYARIARYGLVRPED